MPRSLGARSDETISVGPSGGLQERLALVVSSPRGSFTMVLPAAGTLRIGRDSECEIAIEDRAVSRVHALIHVSATVSIEDAGSRNGTFLLGARLAARERVPLPLGAVLEIGHAVLAFVRHREQEVAAEPGTAPLVVESQAMRELFETLAVIAASDLPVLVLGETGVGKDVVAREIHTRSPRAAGPFLALNCAALAESIVEAELFGYAKGAFTGAAAAKRGLFEAASGGTLLLDEVGDLSPATQAKLLRVIESGEVLALGSTRPTSVDVRFIAATNRDLPAMVKSGRFRADLYFRIDGMTIQIPPLRERRADIVPMAESIARNAASRVGRQPPRFAAEAIAVLEAHPWPGNVRELRNVVERAVILARGAPTLTKEHVRLRSELPRAPLTGARTVPPPGSASRERIVEALERTAGNQKSAATLLGISRRTLIRRMEELAIPRPRKGEPG